MEEEEKTKTNEKNTSINSSREEIIVNAISSLLLKPTNSITETIQHVLQQQQRLYVDIESLNEELEKSRIKFELSNNEERRELEMYCARLSKCRTNVAIIFGQLTVIKQRLIRVQAVILKQNEEKSLQNKKIKEEILASVKKI